jgi:hypothetical protein
MDISTVNIAAKGRGPHNRRMNMGMLLAFAPFIAFAVVDRLAGSVEGLLAGATISAVLLVRDWLRPGVAPKILEIGTFVLFGSLGVYALLGAPNWSIMDVRLRVDAGLLLIVLMTMLIQRPFTMQYAREQVAPELWSNPAFLHANYVITAVWALAFAVMVVADLVLIYMPELSPRFGIIATVVAIVGAVKFTGWYPEREAGAEPSRRV